MPLARAESTKQSDEVANIEAPVPTYAANDFRLLAGRELISTYEAPILRSPPPFRTFFCRRCGSPVPNPEPSGAWFEIPAGALDDRTRTRNVRFLLIDHDDIGAA